MSLEELHSSLASDIVRTDLTTRHAFANDAGPYLLVPEAVLQPKTESDIQAIFQAACKASRPVVFRAGGTSLSGQSITDGWLVDIGRHWRAIEPLENGTRVRVQPGAIGGMVNARLRNFGSKIGPDPSSIMSAMIGGILSNNSSGMCCGVRHNAYHTLRSIRFILPDGTIWDTSRPDENVRFESEAPILAQGISKLRDRVRSTSELSHRIRHKYQQKNTVGYSLNAFLDFDRPLDILAHLLVGAEGTLAFISEAVLDTIPDLPRKATGLAYFDDVLNACRSIPWLIEAGCEAIELMDFASLQSIRHLEGVPIELPGLLDTHDGMMGILFEFHAKDEVGLNQLLGRFEQEFVDRLQVLRPMVMTQDPKQQNYLWKLRKGMYPAVAAVRARGEAAILEDIAVPIDKLGPTIIDLQALFAKHGYENGIIFGHAKDGNLHFVITQCFNGPDDVSKYARFIDDMVALIVNKYDGALKAEHGTGRNMAPFVETEWGSEAVAIMRELKQLIDRLGLLNPDVILSSRDALHLQDIKSLPVVEDVVDKCIECGACEPRCPSRDFTLSPRQRIVLRRSLARAEAAGDRSTFEQLQHQYDYAGLATCATDGLCALDCPVAINTGDLVKHLRQKKTTALQRRLAMFLAQYFGFAESCVTAALWGGTIVNRCLPRTTMLTLTGLAKRIVPSLPIWHRSLRAERLPTNVRFPSEADYIYLPACMSRMMGGTAKAMMDVCQRANVSLYLPTSAHGLCCGQAFSSKGFPEAAVAKQTEWIEQLYSLSDSGRLAIVVDLGSCTAFLKQSPLKLSAETMRQRDALRILDSIEFAHDIVLPKLTVKRKLDSIAIHSVCSNHKIGWDSPLLRIAEACSQNVVQPHAGKCCGMGGDRGFQFPGLTNTATAMTAELMREAKVSQGFTSARSCAIGLETSTGFRWDSIFHLLDAVSRDASTHSE